LNCQEPARRRAHAPSHAYSMGILRRRRAIAGKGTTASEAAEMRRPATRYQLPVVQTPPCIPASPRSTCTARAGFKRDRGDGLAPRERRSSATRRHTSNRKGRYARPDIAHATPQRAFEPDTRKQRRRAATATDTDPRGACLLFAPDGIAG
jgi:hypothetical protein